MADPGEAMSPAERSPTPELLQRTFVELRELLQIEVDLARNEVAAELKAAKAAAIASVVAAVFALCAVNLLLFALFMALGAPVLLGVATGLGMAAAALGCLVWARAHFPKTFLADTRKRLTEDINRLKEHAA